MFNLIIKDCISNESILRCLEEYFKNQNILVAPFDTSKDQHDYILFECMLIKGDFCLQLWLYTKIMYDPKKLAIHICNFEKTKVLLSDESVNPFSWILITSKGEEQVVSQKIDDNDEDLFLIEE